MQNSTKTWRERLKILIPEKTDNVIIHGYRQLTRGKIKQLISDLCKKDEAELIKIVTGAWCVELDSDNLIKLIKDYYENN